MPEVGLRRKKGPNTGDNLMSKLLGLVGVTIALLSSNGAAAQALIGLKCTGHVTVSGSDIATKMDEHFIVDRARSKLIYRDPFSGKAITSYVLRVQARMYSGERISEGKTNGGFPIHHYETVQISREDGSITSTSLSTTTFPKGPSTTEMRFAGRCETENPNQRKSLKF